MKKYIYIILITLFSTINVYAFDVDLDFSKKKSVSDLFDTKYTSKEDSSEEQILRNLSIKQTYLLLGKENESKEEYYNRHNEFLNTMYNKEVPKDESSLSGYLESSIEYKDFIITSTTVPNTFLLLNDLEIVYNNIDSIKVSKLNDDIYLCEVVLPNILMKKEDKNNPYKYNKVKSNLIIYYYFKKQNNDYKLLYLYASSLSELNKYFDKIENIEYNQTKSIISYNSKLDKIYNFEKVYKLDDNVLDNIYIKNINSLVYLTSYYNNKIIDNANGFYITNNLVVTTWDFLENSLINSQYIVLKTSDNKSVNIEEILDIDINNDIVVLKVSESKDSVTISTNKAKYEDVAITISTVTGSGWSIKKGLVISDNDLSTTIPLSESDSGSVLLDVDGNVIGFNNSIYRNNNITKAISSDKLLEIRNKYINNNYSGISFDDLKEKYYYLKINNEKNIKDVPTKIWNKYKKIGNIENSIKLSLIKSSYVDNILSLRYKDLFDDNTFGINQVKGFINNLESDGYKNKYDTDNKKVYIKGSKKVIIINEFDYLIIVMVN